MRSEIFYLFVQIGDLVLIFFLLLFIRNEFFELGVKVTLDPTHLLLGSVVSPLDELFQFLHLVSL